MLLVLELVNVMFEEVIIVLKLMKEKELVVFDGIEVVLLIVGIVYL